jgi:ABC-2 type transport system ATP-binding protein
VCLLVRSKKILEGNLKELKRSHAAGQLRMSLNASDAEVSALPGVATAIPVNGAYVVTLQQGVDRRDFLKRAIEKYEVTSFSDREPELEEIYLAAVQRAGIETRTIE